MHYLIKGVAVCPPTAGDDGKHKVESFNLLSDAISYTDAEAIGTKFYEDNLKKLKYKDFKISKIGVESFNQVKDALSENDPPEFSTVFKAKVTFGYEDSQNKNGATVIVRANTIEEAGEQARQHILQVRSAKFANLTGISETVISPQSPIFNIAKEK